MSSNDNNAPNHFLRQIIDADLASGKHTKIVTRFPPEPNGYLHIGHAKSICLNFGLAQHFQGECNLRFDDTNPEKESQEFIDSIKEDIHWLGFNWAGEVRYASDYFDQLYTWAVELIENGKAFVCHLTPEQMREYRGSLTEPGKHSPYRDRPVAESLAEFEKMRAGEYKEGEAVLRAKIDMASPNINLRDPIIYRVRHVHHHQTGDKWCIYPTYDFTHGQSDAIEGITHSICTLEFEDHRPLYEWYLDNISAPCKPRQYEFARLNLNYTVTSKRKLKQLVDEQHVNGWDDPRMPTISGLRRRGYTAAALRDFCERIGVTRSDGVVDVGTLEFSIREDLDAKAPRAMCVLDPVKVVITNFDADKVEDVVLSNHPKDESMGTRVAPLTREVYIEREDFAEVAPKKWKRMAPEQYVRLRGSYVVRCDEVIKDEQGNVVELRCSYDPASAGASTEYKVNGVIHWVSASKGVQCEVRLYDRLFTEADPEGDKDKSFLEVINPESLVVTTTAWAEPSLTQASSEDRFQFERLGYFVCDRYDHSTDKLVFNRTVGLRDSWAKIQQKG
ncbi:glutamate--tRNA ligase [Pokkaliibacter plantistimulans]|uniref:Glutamine--tRNA ligase n=1 Tax=Pokkaliibacter plantistimulans TaxID=1635171 RepID=A0ABX5M359_9GAMM|nr:glutamine--tRNA ligase/YqeY domain fusion protein [Pokkaliibacter plantistimulans]PXF31335.1 glutamate--tRNA ligase [Pokkaliibacter plantistimulans]